MMAQAKRIYTLMIKINKLDFLFCVVGFTKRKRKHVLCVSTHESLGELKKAMGKLACGNIYINLL